MLLIKGASSYYLGYNKDLTSSGISLRLEQTSHSKYSSVLKCYISFFGPSLISELPLAGRVNCYLTALPLASSEHLLSWGYFSLDLLKSLINLGSCSMYLIITYYYGEIKTIETIHLGNLAQIRR